MFNRPAIRWDSLDWYLPTICWSSVSFSLKMLDPRMVVHLKLSAQMVQQTMGKTQWCPQNHRYLFKLLRTSNDEVRGKSWYYGPISRSDCDVLMAERGQDGDFLVRDSESTVSLDIQLCTKTQNVFYIISIFSRPGTSLYH